MSNIFIASGLVLSVASLAFSPVTVAQESTQDLVERAIRVFEESDRLDRELEEAKKARRALDKENERLEEITNVLSQHRVEALTSL